MENIELIEVLMRKRVSATNRLMEDHSSKSKLTIQFVRVQYLFCAIAVGILLIPCIAQISNSQKLIPFEQNEKWGFINNKGQVVIKPRYDKVEPFSDGLALIEVDLMKGFIDSRGTYVIEPQYYIAFSFSEGLAAVCKSDDSRFGFIDIKGNMVISPKFMWADSFSEGLAAVELPNTGKMGYIDKTGRIIIAAKYDRAYRFSDGLGRISEDKPNVEVTSRRMGFIDKQGNRVIDYFDSAENFSEGLAAVRVNWRRGFIDKTGTMVIPPVYGLTHGFSEGYASVQCENDKYAFIDKAGVRITDCSFDETSDFNEGLAVVLVKNGWGFINGKGRFMIKPQFDYANDFSNGLAKVRLIKNGWFYEGYIDHQGKYVIKPIKRELAKFEKPDPSISI